MANPELLLEIVLDDGSVQKGFAKIENQAKTSGSQVSSFLNSGLTKTIATIGTVGTALAAAFAGKEVIAKAKEQQSAVNALNTQLKITGDYSQQVSQDLQDYASSIQAVTKFGDEAVLGQLAFSQAMGASVEQSKAIVAAATDMSAALSIDFNSAVRNISKTLGGYAGELGEVIPELKNLTAEQLQAGEGIDLLAAKYSGSALGAIQTYDGAMTQLENTFGDTQEAVGAFVVDSDLVTAAIKTVTETFSDLNKEILSNLQNGGLEKFNAELLNTGYAINDNFIVPLQYLGDVGSFVFSAIKSGLQTILNGFTALGSGFADILNMAGIENDFTQSLKTMHEATNELTVEMANDTAKAWSDIGQEDYAGVSGFLDRIKQKTDELAASTSVLKNITKTEEGVAGEEANPFQSFSEGFSSLETDSLKGQAAIDNFNKKMVELGKQTKDTMRNGFGSSLANGFSAFGAALVNGENAMEAFGKAMLATLGQTAVQLGTSFILKGIAYSFDPLMGGPAVGGPLIAAGAALATFGGALSAFAGGSTSSASSAATDSNNEYSTTSTYDEDDYEEETETTSVTVNIQGDVFDSDETGTRIAQILEDASLSNGVVIGSLA